MVERMLPSPLHQSSVAADVREQALSRLLVLRFNKV